MQFRKRVKWDHGEQMMFNVVIHVEVEKTEHRIHLHCARVKPVIAHIFSQTGMLSQRENLIQPTSVPPREREKQQRKPTPDGDGPNDHSRINQKVATRPPEHLPPLALRHEVSRLSGGRAERMENHYSKHLDRGAYPEKMKQHSAEICRAHHLDLRIQAHHDRLRVVPRVAP